MSRYRKTFREAMAEVELNEVGYLQPRMNDRQLANIKNVWKHKTKKDVTPAVKKMIANMDIPTQLAIKQANINQLSDLIEGRMKDIFTMDKEGKSAAEIAKYLKLDVKTVKGILGEQDSPQDMQDVKKQKEVKEAGDHEISMAKGELEAIADKATKLAAALQSKSDDTDGLEAWVQSKITKAKDYINSASDYMMYNKGNTNEEVEKKVEKEQEEEETKPEVKKEKSDDKEKLKQAVNQKQAEIDRLKAKAETDKAKVAKKETEKMVNPETGEPLLQVGIAYKHMRDKMKREKEEVKEETILEFTSQQIKMAYGVANDKRYKAGNYSGAVAAIEKIAKGLSKHPDVAKVLKKVNEVKEEEIKEFKKMKVTIQDMDKRKKAIADLMKQNLGVSVNGGVIRVDGKGKDLNNFAKDLMNFYGANVVAEETIEEGITPQMIATLKKEYEPFRGKKISAARARQLMNILNKFKDSDLQKLGKENIPFISSGSKSKLAVRNMKFTVKNIEFGEELDEEMFEACWTGYKQVGMKNKGGKQVPNCVPEELNKDDEKVIKKVKDMLKGASAKHASQAKMIDKALKNEMKKDDAYAIGMAQAKKVMNDEPPLQKKTIKKGHEIADKILKKDENAPSVADVDRLKKQGMKPKMKNEEHPAREVYESIAAVRKKAEKSGMPYGVLKKVYDRGMAAWRGGHRPGATQVQWALARVNSFVTKSSGTWGGADKDLAKQVRGK